jgi:hypothetical protein
MSSNGDAPPVAGRGEMSPAEILRNLRTRIRRERRAFESIRSDDRRSGDETLREEHAARNETQRDLRVEQRRALAGVQKQKGEERTIPVRTGVTSSDHLRSLWKTLSEIDVIATAIHGLRLRALGSPEQQELFTLASEIEGATERVLEILADILDPEDDRGIYRDTDASASTQEDAP